MRIAICPGSFDPVTKGHLDVVERTARLFDRVYVAVLANAAKKPLFSVAERVELLQQATAHLHNVRSESYTGLVVDYATARGASVIVRGVRGNLDVDYEWQMAAMNRELNGTVETLFMPTAPQYAQVSSSLVKEVAAFGGDVGKWVPESVAVRLLSKLQPKEGAED